MSEPKYYLYRRLKETNKAIRYSKILPESRAHDWVRYQNSLANGYHHWCEPVNHQLDWSKASAKRRRL